MVTRKFYLKLLMSLLLVALAVPQGKADDVTVAEDATADESYVPLYGSYMENTGTYSQTIYTSTQLADIAGNSITAITYYPESALPSNLNGNVLEIFLKEVDEDGFSSTSPITGMTSYGTSTISSGDTQVVFNLNTPFNYTGNKNLAIEVHVKAKGSNSGWASGLYWYAKTSDGNIQPSLYHYSTTTSKSWKIPKTTFTYESAGPAVPTITVNPAAVSITTAPSTTGTATFTVSGTNLTHNITLTASDGFSVNPTTIEAVDGAVSATQVTVIYQAPGTTETKTGEITISSTGADDKTVNITAESKEIIAEGTVTPTSLNFGEVLVGQTSAAQLVRVENTGSDTFTPSFSIDNPAFSIDAPTAIVGGTSISYNVIFTPTAAGVQTGVLTVKFGGLTHTVTLTGQGKELAAYDITSSAASGVHNFGDVFKDGLATWNVTLTNNGANAVTPVIEGLDAPFSAENVPATIPAGESATITFKFAPTAIQAYGPTSIVVKFAETTDFQFDYTFRGNGIENTGTLPPSTFDNYSYTWTDKDGNGHTSKVSEIATEPEQMIALLREVYTNKNLPGPKYRGYDENGNPETAYPVPYPAIGTMTRFGTFGVTENYTFNDAYGWGFTHDETNFPSEVLLHNSGSHNYYKGLNGNEYKPNEEGLTLLLVEMKDGANSTTVSRTISSSNTLVNIFSKMFKSVRVITNSKKVTKNGVEGTLFKIDCDKMNRFFFLGKGRLRLQGENDADGGLLGRSNYFIDKDNSTSSSGSITNVANDGAPFFEMFEQFSPVSLIEGTESSDVYQELINMKSYAVEHDCVYIPWAPAQVSGGEAGHEFNMYGKTSISDDCQDVRDLMFFVPDQRMKKWDSRDRGANDKFVNYYDDGGYAPNMGLYVIRQNEITGERNGTAESYTLHLSWDSNLTDFVPSDKGVYYIYQVNDNGSYTKVGETNSQTKELDLDVNMAEHGQQVTYVIQGRDNTGFLSLQFSNEESFIIPGLDENEKFQMMPGAEYYSRFDPQTVHNFYANGMQVMAYPDATTSDYAGKTFNFYRKAATDNDWTLVGTAQVNNAGTEATVSMVEGTQRQQSEYKFGYKQNPATVAVTTDTKGNKVFGVIFDNFKANVSTNQHPSSYSYKMEVANTSLHSNEISIKVYKTQMRNLTGTFTEEYVENDEVRQDVDNSRQFDIDVEHSSKTDILRYGAYRWNSSYGTSSNPFAILNLNSTEEEDISPQGQASNQGEFYSVYMNGDSYIGDDVYVAQGETGQATFVDDVPATTNAAEEYTYVPVIETFTGRADYNTYGAPMQTTATGKIVVNVENAGKSEYTWEADGNTYRYYNVFVDVNTLELPEGYEVAKVRAWRKIDASYLNEKLEAYAYRANLDANGEFMFDDPTAVPANDKLGSEPLQGSSSENEMYRGTFGALDVSNGATVPMKFFVRVYFTKNGDDTPAVTYDPIYVIGSNNNWDTSTSIGQLTSTDGSKYSGTLTISNSGDGYGYFSFTTQLGNSLADIAKYRYGANANGDFDMEANGGYYEQALDLKWWQDGSRAFKVPAGNYNITINNFVAEPADPFTAGSITITKASAKAPMLRDTNDGKYYITEVEVDGELNSSIPTSIFGVVTVKEVARVKYYNMAGIESDVPFQGVNIEVTTYTDGSRTTRKIMK